MKTIIRIADGRFTFAGKAYQLACNNGPNHLHGGVKGFDKHVWNATPIETDKGPALKLTHLPVSGEENYPGNLSVTVVTAYHQYNGFCLETQTFPDAIHQPAWQSPALHPGEVYRHVMITKIGVQD